MKGVSLWKFAPHAIVKIVWRERNIRVFEGVSKGVDNLINQVKECVWLWTLDLNGVGVQQRDRVICDWDKIVYC